MAGYGYSYGSESPIDGFDPWKAERSRNSEQLCRPALDESEGRRMTAGDPFQNPGTYVMKVETTVERVHPSVLSEYYRQCSPPRYEHRPSYGGVNNKQHGPSIPTNDWPPVVEEFFNKIQNEVSQQPFGFGAPRAPYQLRIPLSAGYCGTTGNAGDSDHDKGRHKLMSNTMKDEGPKADKILKPPVTTEGGNWPRPGHPTRSTLPNYYIPSERVERTIQPPSRTMTGDWERRGHDMGLEPMNEIGEVAEYPKELMKPPPVSRFPKRFSNPETIDSKEGRRQYGNLNPAPEQHVTGNASTIDSREAAKKYNGLFVPKKPSTARKAADDMGRSSPYQN